MSTLTSAISGGTTGASLGAPLGPAGAIVGGAVGALGGALSTAGQNKYNKKNKKLLDKDLEAMEQGQLGLTQAEKTQAVRDAMGLAGQQAGQAQTQIARDSLGSTGARDMGQYAKAQQAVGAQVGEAGARAGAQAQAMSQQQAEARRQEIMARLERQQAVDMEKSVQNKEAMDGAAKDVGTFTSMLRSEYPDLFEHVGADMGGGVAAAAPNSEGAALHAADAMAAQVGGALANSVPGAVPAMPLDMQQRLAQMYQSRFGGGI